MIIRNSIKSIYRTPAKTALFLFLIIAVTTLFYLGVNTWASSIIMLNEAEKSYLTIASFKRNTETGGAVSGAPRTIGDTEWQPLDESKITASEYVISYQPHKLQTAYISSMSRDFPSAPYRDRVVLIIHDAIYAGVWYAKIDTVISSARAYKKDLFAFLNGAKGYEFKSDKYYVIEGSLSDTGKVMPTVNIYSAEEVTDIEAFIADEDNEYIRHGKFFDVVGKSIVAVACPDLQINESFHQRSLYLLNGRYYTPEEAASGEKVCVITKALSNSLRVTSGDTIDLSLFNTEFLNEDVAVAEGDITPVSEYTVVGVIDSDGSIPFTIYVPGGEGLVDTPINGYIGSAHIQNGKAEEFIEYITPYLPADVSVTIFDHGFANVEESLNSVYKTSIVVTIVAAIATLVVIFFFAFLFVGRQRETVVTMTCLGTRTEQIVMYLLTGSGLIALLAVVCGSFIGHSFGDELIAWVYNTISELQIGDMRFSDSYVGVIDPYTPISATGYWLLAVVCVVVLAISLLLCYVFAMRIMRAQKPKRNRVRHAHKPPKHSCASLGKPFKYVFLSIRRGGVRSLIVPLVSLVMSAFLIVLTQISGSYADAMNNLYQNTDIRGCITAMNYTTVDGLLATKYNMMEIVDSGYANEFSFCARVRGGCVGMDFQPPSNGWELESELQRLTQSAYCYFTSNIEGAPEFSTETPMITWLDSYDKNDFYSDDYSQIPCLLSDKDIDKYDVELGETVCLTVLVPGTYNKIIVINAFVAGSFKQVAAETNVYLPLPSYFFDYSEAAALLILPKLSTVNSYSRYDTNVVNSENGIETLDGMLGLLARTYITSCGFKLKEASKLDEFKDKLAELGYSCPGVSGSIRIGVRLADRDFCSQINELRQRMLYMDILIPTLCILIGLVGLIVSYLTVNSRKEELAIMRGIGTSGATVFITFFGEQVILSLFGITMAFIAAMLFDISASIAAVAILVFLACYLVGSALSVIILNGSKLLSILAERE